MKPIDGGQFMIEAKDGTNDPLYFTSMGDPIKSITYTVDYTDDNGLTYWPYSKDNVIVAKSGATDLTLQEALDTAFNVDCIGITILQVFVGNPLDLSNNNVVITYFPHL